MALTADERYWALGEISRIMEEECEACVDNERVADPNDSAEMREFDEQSFHGCCGTMEKEVVHPQTGKRILIGCNYGH